MAERPMLFSGAMVRAILAGTKTQTRRIAPIRKLDLRRHPGDVLTWSVSFLKAVKGALSSHSGGKFTDLQARSIIASQFNPYGRPGDRLWVRETWAYGVHAMASDRDEDGPFVYAADGTTQGRLCDRWRPSIHMPRAASRITLEITGVRVERLQDITPDDCSAEGISLHHVLVDARQAKYRDLWESINGPGSWDANPWVWVIEFRRVS